MGNKAIFLDRDGTINVEVHYLHEPEKFEFEFGVIETLKVFKQAGFLIIVITNQGAIGKGLYYLSDMQRTHDHMKMLLENEGIVLDGIYYCPHSAAENCNCRKPKPGMIIKAIDDFDIDVNGSWMIGDKLSDIEAGNRAGLKTILVRTGYGFKEEKNLDQISISSKKRPHLMVNNLKEIIQYIL